MKKYLYDYIKEIDGLLDSNKKISNDTIENQHERLIHLLVTLFYALLFILFGALCFVHYMFVIIVAPILIFLICYIIHYFHLENGVQYLYKQYDKMRNR